MNNFGIDSFALEPIEPESEGCRLIAKAIEDYHMNGGRNPYFLYTALLTAAGNDTELLAPVMREQDDIMAYLGDTSADADNMTFQSLDMDGVGEVFALFTNREELRKGADTESITISLVQMLEYTLESSHIAGLVLNPFGSSAFISRDRIGDILEQCQPPTRDKLDLESGVEAFAKGDYATAVSYYRKSAGAGNISAIRNLGYCYYHGYGVDADKTKAHLQFEKAAVFGDPTATYMLGDMYRNGDLPEDYPFSRALFRKAFVATREIKDPGVYPDTCLRILKYCREELTREDVRYIAEDAIEGFTYRVEIGDFSATVLLQEAKAILRSLPETDTKFN